MLYSDNKLFCLFSLKGDVKNSTWKETIFNLKSQLPSDIQINGFKETISILARQDFCL